MSSASDIANLFGVAGGSPAQYQEVERKEQTQGARGRWAALPAAELIPSASALVAPATLETAQADTTPGDAPDVVHADVPAVAPEAAPEATPEATPEAPQRLIAWTIAATAAEPPPVVLAVSEVEPVAESVVPSVAEPVAESEAAPPVAPATPVPAVIAATAAAEPQPAALSSVFARLLARNESRDDVPPHGTP